MNRVKLAVCLALAAVFGVAPATAQPLYNWGGFYAGGHAGAVFGSGSAEATEDSIGAPYNDFGDRWPLDLGSGANFGVQVGFNRQNRALLFGVEADFGRQAFDGSAASAASEDTVASSEGGFTTTVRGRAGYVTGRYLVFATAGFASIATTGAIVDDCDDDACGPAMIRATRDSRATGPIFGAGVEYALRRQSRMQISVKAEWLHAVTSSSASLTARDSFDDEHGWELETRPARGTIRAGVNVRFP